MARSVLSAVHFQDDVAAFAYVEAHLWPNGPVCPHCGETERVGRLNGKTTRPGLCKCYACQKPFTVRMGSIFESSHLPLRYWLQVIYLMSASKKGISTRQIQRTLKCSMKTAWFLTHRVREIMKPAKGVLPPLGGTGVHVEADETYIGRKRERAVKQGTAHKMTVFSLVERGGEARSFHIDRPTISAVGPLIVRNVDIDSTLNTDENKIYSHVGKAFAGHQVVKHRDGEYVRGTASTNTLEGFFSVFKRGMVGTYQQVSEAHLHRYLAEFDFRYSKREKLGIDDTSRASAALLGAKGKRLTYQTTRGTQPGDAKA